jgi:toxin YoeB
LRLVFEPEATEDFRFWVETDRRKALNILDLIEAAQHDPFSGVGKPEALKFGLADCWSRRMDQEHRLVYRVVKDELIIISCRHHY